MNKGSGSPTANLRRIGAPLAFLRNNRALRVALAVFIAARVVLSLWAWLVLQLNPLVVSNLDLFGEKVVVAFDWQTGQRAVFSRVLDGRELHFRPMSPNSVDVETNSVWDLYGRAVSGALIGAQLADSTRTVEEIFPYHGVAIETNPLLAPWQRFDANWYVAIAKRGYGTILGDARFPPLYPALIRLIGRVIGNDLAAALFISNIALSATLAVLYLYVTEKFDESVARRTLICLIVFPTAFFFFGAYTEGLFLLTALLSMIAIEREHWLWAGVAIFCAVLFRLQGIALFAPLAYSLWTTRSRGANIARVVGGAIALLALALYLLMRYALGEITVVPISDPSWHARLVSPWQSYFYALQTIASGKFLFADVLNLIVTTLCIFILIVGWKRLPMNWLLYAAASLIVLTMQYLETMPLKSMSRYALTLFPVFVLVGVWGRSGWRQRVIIYSCLVLFLFLTAQFVLWGWVA